VWKTNLTRAYSIAQLNALSGQVVVEALHHGHFIAGSLGNQTQLVNPLFADGLDFHPGAHVQVVFSFFFVKISRCSCRAAP
jgi:hypothetical protein